jgi:hypothetical protein
LERLELDDVLKLPATMDVARARAVFEDLCNRRGAPLTLDASERRKGQRACDRGPDRGHNGNGSWTDMRFEIVGLSPAAAIDMDRAGSDAARARWQDPDVTAEGVRS